MGNSGRRLCDDGCAISSVAMALTGIGNTYTPKTLNQYYTNNNYYQNGNHIDWTKVNGLGLIYQQIIWGGNLPTYLTSNKIGICNVRGGAHWVLCTSVSGNTVYVKDPYYNVSTYQIADVTQAVIYRKSGHIPMRYLTVDEDPLEKDKESSDDFEEEDQ